jgi:mannosyl-oligosaccharide alpha-1,2-mannosidase
MRRIRNGWGATAVEALGTATIMDIPEIVDEILDYIPTINFQKTKDPVDLFETTIRYLGGMLSAYELLTGPMHHLAHNKVNSRNREIIGSAACLLTYTERKC